MGGLATLAAAPRLGSKIAGVALWSPGLMSARVGSTGEWMEKDGQRVRWDFWREAAGVDAFAAYGSLRVPLYAVFGTADEYGDSQHARAFAGLAKPDDRVDIVVGLPHNAWPEPHRGAILRETAVFCERALR